MEKAVRGTTHQWFAAGTPSWSEADRDHTATAGQGFGGNSSQAQRWLDSLDLPQVGQGIRLSAKTLYIVSGERQVCDLIVWSNTWPARILISSAKHSILSACI